MRKLLVFCALAALSACSVETMSRPADPYASVDRSSGAYKELVVAVIRSDAMQRSANQHTSSMCYGGIYNPRKYFDQSAALLERSFDRAVFINKPEDARAAKADLIAILDDESVLSCGRATMDLVLRATFLTLDERVIDSISAENWKGSSKTNPRWNPFGKGSGRIVWPKDMEQAVDEALNGFEGALFASAKLRAFAKGGAAAVAGDSFRRSDVDDLPEAAAPERPGHAVVIGIEGYRAGLPAAAFAAADARLVAKYLTTVLGYPESEVTVLVDAEAGKGDFEKYFEAWLPSRVKPGDEVFVYFSGHGAPNPADGEAYLVPYDGDPTYLAKTSYPVARLYAGLSKLPASKVTVALDSCFSGAGGRSVIASGARPLVNVAQTAIPANISVIAAAKGDQVSNTYKEKGHGLFTYFFLRGLKAKGADLPAVYGYLKGEVAKAARRDFNAGQDPQWLGAR